MSASDTEILEAVFRHLLHKARHRATRGERADAYRKMALAFGVDEATPRQWFSRGIIPRHVRRQMEAMLESEEPTLAIETDAMARFDPAVLMLAARIQRIHDWVGGQGLIWNGLVGYIDSLVPLAQRIGREVRNAAGRVALM